MNKFIKLGGLFAVALFACISGFAQTAPPPGAYVAPNGDWLKRGDFALPISAGHVENDGSKAADYATLSEVQQLNIMSTMGANAPTGLVVAHWYGYTGYFVVHAPGGTAPPKKEY